MASHTKFPLFSNFTPKPHLKFHPSPASPSRPSSIKPPHSCHSDQDPKLNQPNFLISILRVIPDWADDVQEQGMRKPRTLYNHEKWVEHRSSLRHLRHLFSSPSSRVILSLVPPVIAFTGVAFAVATYNTAVWLELLPEFFPVLRASSLPYQLTAPALALLLVFRTEASYSRFQEGRQAWTKIIAGTSDFARQVITSVRSPTDSGLKTALLSYIMAFPVALKCHLTYGSDISRDLSNLLEGDDLSVVLKSSNRPQCIIQFITQCLRLLSIDNSKRNLLESKISCFHDGISICEQLVGIPIPLSYTRLTSRFLVLWHLTLPIILWDDCHWIVVPATFISAASLFCIEEVGVLIEEPFPMLALDDLCDLVQLNIQQAIESEGVIRENLAAKRRRHHLHNESQNGRPEN